MYLLYDLALLVAAAGLIPFYFLRGLKHGKARRGIRERLGFYAPGRLAPIAGREVIWVHAVSVGETRAAVPLLKALRQAFPEAALILSNVTETGHEVARGLKDVDLCLFYPFDLSWAVRRALRQVQPRLVIIVETEIWPNFVRLAKTQGIPVVLVNGRISDRSFPRYLRLRGVLRPVLEQFDALCMQTALDAERIARLGAPAQRLEMTGNLKFDMAAPAFAASDLAVLRRAFRLPEAAAVWVAGSTHAGEEEAVLDTYRELLAEGRRLVLVLVPRHPERCRSVGELLIGRGFAYALRSQVEALDRELEPGAVLLVDTLGEMLKVYALADLVFVGGSLVPVGGHNILEASLLKKAVLFGPYTHNFKEIVSLIQEVGGGEAVDGREGLGDAVRRLLDDPDSRAAMGESGFSLLRQNAGATERSLTVIRRVLGR